MECKHPDTFKDFGEKTLFFGSTGTGMITDRHEEENIGDKDDEGIICTNENIGTDDEDFIDTGRDLVDG